VPYSLRGKKLFYLTTELTEKIAQSSQRFYLKKNLVPWSLRGKKLFYLTTEHTEKIAQSSKRFYLKKNLVPWSLRGKKLFYLKQEPHPVVVYQFNIGIFFEVFSKPRNINIHATTCKVIVATPNFF